MIKLLTALLLTATACTTIEIDVGHSCGVAPARPNTGWAIAYQGDSIAMPRAQWLVYEAWVDELETWTLCVEEAL